MTGAGSSEQQNHRLTQEVQVDSAPPQNAGERLGMASPAALRFLLNRPGRRPDRSASLDLSTFPERALHGLADMILSEK